MKSSSPAQTTSTPTDDRLYMPTLGSFKACGLIVGFLVGLFIYLSTLGAEFVAVMLWGKEILAKTNQELVLLSLGWNLLTTLLALVVLSCLRRMVVSIFTAAISHRNPINVEDLVSELLSYLEGRFAVGALVGICVAWNITNMVLGMRPQIIQSCVILAVACLWCRITLVILGNTSKTLIYEEEEQSQTVAMCTGKQEQGDKLSEPLLNV